MIRLAVSEEGQTEEKLVKGVLAPGLWQCGIAAAPVLLAACETEALAAGHVTVPRLVTETAHLSRSFDAVTTFVDFYGFGGKEQHSAAEVGEFRVVWFAWT